MNSKKNYPEIKVEKPNTYYGELLLNNYAGLISEDTAIHQYVYQSLITDDEELKHALKDIARTEMIHLRLLGETIALLGVDPRFRTNNQEIIPWNSDYVNYETNVLEFLKYNMQQEKNAIESYEDNSSKIEDQNIKKLLERIIDDEIKHIHIFYSFYKKYNN